MKIFSGIAADVFFGIIAISINIISLPIYITILGLENYGLWIAISSLVALIGMIDLSVDPHLIKMSADDQMFLGRTWYKYVRKVALFKFSSGIVFSVGSIFLYNNLKLFFDINENAIITTKIVIIICGVSSVLNLANGYFLSILYARGAQVFVNSLNGIMSIVSILCGICLVMLGFNIIGIASGLAISTICSFFVSLSVFRKYVLNSSTTFGEGENPDPSFIEIFKYSYNFHLLKTIFLMRVNGFPVILGSLVSIEFSGYYNIIIKVPQLTAAFAAKITTPFFPSFSHLISQNLLKKLKRDFFRLACIMTLISLLALVSFLAFLPFFVQIWVGMELELNLLLISVILYFSLQIFFSPFFSLVYASGQYGKGQFFSLIELMSFAILVTLFVKIMGADGAVIGLLLSGLITQLYFANYALGYLAVQKVNFLWKILLSSVPFIVIPMLLSTYLLSTGALDALSVTWPTFLVSVFLFVVLGLVPIPILAYKYGSISKAMSESFSYES